MRVASAAGVYAAICFVASGLVPNIAQAEEAPAEPVYDPDWGIDLGLGMGGLVGTAVGNGPSGAGVGGLVGPTLAATLERRLDDHLWAMLAGGGSYLSQSDGYSASLAWALDGSLGLRHVLTPPEPIEVSWYGALRGSYGRYEPPSSRTFTAGIVLGLALDKHFTDWLGLRLRVDVAELGYQRYRGPDGTPPAEGLFAQLRLAPSLALRFAF
jgi:hypothetical protein